MCLSGGGIFDGPVDAPAIAAIRGWHANAVCVPLNEDRLSHLGWAGDSYDCGGFPALITDYSGVPTRYGIGLKRHLAALVP